MKLFSPLMIVVLSSCFFASSFAKDGIRLTLPSEKIAVISNGDLEAASIGTYSVVVYKNNDLIDFESGAIFSRDGSLFQDDGKPRVKFADIDGDGSPELIVIKTSAGSGNYTEVDAIRITENKVDLLIRIHSDTRKNEVVELQKTYQKQQNNRTK